MMTEPRLHRDPSLDATPMRIALVWASGLTVSPSSGVAATALAALLGRVCSSGEAWLSESRKKAVRDLLRHGVYKPAGRAKPSSEYLLAAALGDDFPLVNGAVDANNAASLEFGYPASVFDLALAGTELLLRRGGPGDSYAFNPAGQEIALEDLLCVWRRSAGAGDEDSWLPTGNPVKDSMATKVFEGCSSVVAVIYAPDGPEGRDLEACAERFVALLRSECAAREAGWRLA
jgi:DNA/RNA-binding domain of Phe-tRNA-synthetase-like protein